jgi:CheY-like chemotaxis protein
MSGCTMSADLNPLVLVVEDDLASRILLREVLRRWDYRTILAGDGIEALERLAEQQDVGDAVDLVILDIQMPRLDGYGVLARIRGAELTAHLPVIAVSAFALPEDRERALGLGMDSFVSKPVDLVALKAEVSWLLEARRGG